MIRIVYIKKAEIVENYFIGEYVGDNRTWKVQETFANPSELIDYLTNSEEKYIQELRKRKNLEIIINVPNAAGESLFSALKNIEQKFRKICIRKSPINNH